LVKYKRAAIIGIGLIGGSFALAAHLLGVCIGLTCLLTCGCVHDEPQYADSPQRIEHPRPQGVGAIERIQDPDPEWSPGYGGRAEAGPEPTPELAQRVQEILRQQTGMDVKYSPDAAHALLYLQDSAASEVSLWLVTKSAQQRFTVKLPPALKLDALWSPDNRYVVVWPSPWQPGMPKSLTFICLSLAEKGNAKVRIVRGPPESGSRDLGLFNTDGSVLFATSPQGGPPGMDRPGGQLWTIAMPECKFSLLYTQPPPQWPPHVQEKIPRHGPPGYTKQNGWGFFLSSPSGELLLFNSYPPDNYMAEALWVANLRTRQVRQVTWEDRERCHHFPIRWKDDDRSFVFLGSGGYYTLTLPSDLWEEQTQGAGESQ